MKGATDKRALGRLLDELERDVPGVIETISPRETMHDMHQGGALDGYLLTGQWAVKRMRLALLAARKTDVRRILDLPCGYGRVARTLRAEFLESSLTVCDIDREAVEFCCETFGAKPTYGTERPQEIELKGRFDLIWCGSLVTHLDRDGWVGFLQLFEAALKPGGVLVFTAQGRFVADKLHRTGVDRQALSDEQVEALRRSYDEDGFGYCNYEHPEALKSLSLPPRYGISLASASWVCRLLAEETPKLDLLSYTAGGNGLRWGANVPGTGLNAQDVISCIRVNDDEPW